MTPLGYLAAFNADKQPSGEQLQCRFTEQVVAPAGQGRDAGINALFGEDFELFSVGDDALGHVGVLRACLQQNPQQGSALSG